MQVVEVLKSLKMNHVIHEFEFGPPLPNTHRWEEVCSDSFLQFKQIKSTFVMLTAH